MLRTFKLGGIHPSDNKFSKGAAIEIMPLPKRVAIPLSQHIGAPAEAVVSKGDKVLVGDLIGRASGFVSSNIHSSVSGTIASIEAVSDTSGIKKVSVVIDVEADVWNSAIDTSKDLKKGCSLSSKEIITKIAEAGIVGMGGATFPTQVKLSVPPGKRADYLIINGVECEPYLTSDHRVMLERCEELLVGVDILRKALEVSKAYIGVENNKPDAIDLLRAKAAAYGPSIEVVPLKVQYPQGGEKQLIDAIVGRQVPSGALPIDVNSVVQNASTALAVYEAVMKNKPLFERVVTITGKGVANPRNLQVRIGTPLSELLAYCNIDVAEAGKVINGGPMMGRAVANLSGSVTKGTSGVLLMQDAEARRAAESPCIRCGKCVGVCPMGLEPYLINAMSRLGRYEELEAHKATDCIECGSCSYTCPANIALLDYIRVAKAEVMKIIRSRK